MWTNWWRRSNVLASRFVNTSPLVFLARENLLEILQEGALEVVVPQPVIEEIRVTGRTI
jgi:hypothetical protein